MGDLCHRIGDGIHSTPVYSERGDVYFINGNNLSEGNIHFTLDNKKVTLEESKKHYRPLSDDTILLSINGTIGNIAFYQHEKVILGKSACYINANVNHLSKRFLYSFLRTNRVLRYFDSELTGSTIKNLSLAAVRKLEIALPTLTEQTKIADFLTAIDKNIEQLTHKKSLLEQKKKALMQKLLTGQIRVKV